jgi:hypothetical protein
MELEVDVYKADNAVQCVAISIVLSIDVDEEYFS